jgi:glycosyltransferase involved in cell wall biosynthesis
VTSIDRLVELVEHGPSAPFTGIGRYTEELHRHLEGRVAVRRVRHVAPPLTSTFNFLHYFPIGVARHERGALVHFMEDVGCAQMLWRPIHPAVATSHDLGMLVWPQEAGMHRRLDRLTIRLSYEGLRRMDAVITISDFSRRQLIERLGIADRRVFAIHSGIDHGRFHPREESRRDILMRYGIRDSPEYRYLLYVGSELPRKNLPTVLRAMRQLPDDVRLLKVGSAGPPRFRVSTMRHVDTLGLAGRVSFVEQVSEADLVALYNIADVYVCVSFLEGFGQPVLEAMSCGLPVVCSDTTSLPEITGDAALRIDPGDVATLAAALRRVLDDPSLHQQMIRRGLERAKRFTWHETAARVADVYRRVLGGELRAPTTRAPRPAR